MSILSMQIGELREKSDELRDMGMTDTPDMLREAADTIEGMRDRLQAGACEKRIEQLETLVRDLWRDYNWATGDLENSDYTKSRLQERMAALGLLEGDGA